MMSKHTELYVSVDVETDGPIPGENSMLSLGAAAFLETGEMVGTFSRNIFCLPGAKSDAGTMAWWAKNKPAYDVCRTDCEPAAEVMLSFLDYVRSHCRRFDGLKPVFVGYPTGFDFTFVYWYLMKFTGGSPFSFSALDIKTMAMVMLDLPFRGTTKKAMPKRWFSEKPHTHVAVDDAIEQGEMFINMLKECRDQSSGLQKLQSLITDSSVSAALRRAGVAIPRLENVLKKALNPEAN